MRRTATPLVLLVVLCSQAAAEPRSWDYSGHGQWEPATQPSASPIIPDATLDRVEQLLDAHQTKRAYKILVAWVKQNPAAPDRDRALFLLAEADFQRNKRIRAFYQLDELLEKYPESRFFYPGLQRQYEIADAYLKGHKDKFLGLPLLSQEDTAIEMLFRIQERSPGSPLAEQALLRTANYYYRSSQFDLAGEAYAAYIRSYPRSPQVAEIKLREAFSSLAQFRGVRFDATPLIDAKAQFKDLIEKYPEMAKQENLPEIVGRIDSTLAAKMYHTADFYRRTHKPGAAVYTYRSLIETYPATQDAELARKALAKMPASALQETGPTSPAPMPPATSPVSSAE